MEARLLAGTCGAVPAVRAEIHKTRPAVVMNAPEVGRLPLGIVVPVAEWKPAFN